MKGLGRRFNLKALVKKFSLYLPLTYTDIIAKSLKGCRSILDVGCGRGELMENLNRRVSAYRVGLDLYLPYLYEAKKRRSYDDLICADVRWLPIRPGSFDGVLCSQVIEHLSKDEGLELVQEIEAISRLRVVIGTTIGYVPYLPLDQNNNSNPFQVHKSGWAPETFYLMGYHVRFQGLKLAYGPRGFMRKVPRFLRPLLGLIPYVIAPIIYFSSRLAIYQVAHKDVQKNS